MSQPSGLNQGLAPIAFGSWVLCDFFADGELLYVSLDPTGRVIGLDPSVTGLWNTDHNGLNQPAACVFLTVTKVVSGAASTIQTRVNFSATPIAAQDGGAAKVTTYAPNTDNMTLNPTSKKVGRVLSAFQLYATSN